jgi:hypothetical protein
MLARLVAEREHILKAIVSLSMTDAVEFVQLTPVEWVMLESVCGILQPFLQATEDASGEKYVTSSLVIPGAKSIINHLDFLVPACEQAEIASLVDWLRTEAAERFDHLFRNPTLQLCTLLHPRFKSLVDTAEVWSILKDKALKVNKEVQDAPQPPRKQAPISTPKKESLYAHLGLDDGAPEGEGLEGQIDAEIVAYKALKESRLEPKKLLQWWVVNKPRFPNLYQVAIHYLSIPASEVSSERAFSWAGTFFSNTRAAMSPKLLSDMHFIYSNDPFLLEKREVRREKKKKSKEPREDEDVSAGTEGSTTNESEGSESSDEGEDETVITLALAVDKSSFSDK